MTTSMRWFGIDVARHRWIFPAVGAIATTLVGAAYAFSVFIVPLEAEFQWQRSQTLSAFSAAMFFLGLFAFVGGLLTDRFGPRPPFIVGSAFMVVSQLLASQTNSITMLIVSYGIVLGIGLGLVYASVSIPLMARWFPDAANRGSAIGLSLLGMGIGSLVAAPLWTWSITAMGWRLTYAVTGGVFLVILAVLATILRMPTGAMLFHPDRGWFTPAPGEPIPPDAISGYGNPADYNLAEAVRSPYLWLMGLLFFLTIFGGLMVMGSMAAFAREAPPLGPAMDAKGAAAIVMMLSLFNGLGRPGWGWVSGRIGIRNALVLCPLLMAAGLLLLSPGRPGIPFWAGAVCTGFAFGGTLALIPVMTTALFGATFVGRIYGLVFFLGFGLGGFFGPMVGGWLRTTTGAYTPTFYASIAMCLLASGLAGWILPGKGMEKRGKTG